jgi:hypothetical protein
MANRYKLKTLRDVYEQIPADKLHLCLREIADGMQHAKALADLLDAAVSATEPGARAHTFWPEECEWIDDGKEDKTINVACAGSDYVAFNYEAKKSP